MFRSSLYVAGALLLSTSAFAQRDASAKLHPITTDVKHGGTYHVATKTWSRTAVPMANLGPDTLYNNTCFIAFFVGLSTGETLVDSGRVPSQSSPTTGTSVTGDENAYVINGLQYEYCTAEAVPLDINISHIACYAPCAEVPGLPTVAAFAIAGAPSSVAAGSQSCWIINIDLEGTPDEFTLAADCDGVYDASPASDNFGWSILFVTDPLNGAQGPAMAGDPFGVLSGGPNGTGCPYGDGTKWKNPTAPEGTGIGSDDVFITHDGSANLGCWFFGGYLQGNPYSSFSHQLFGDVGGTAVEPGVANCDADGINATPCPCGNNNDGSAGIPAGCRNANNAAGASITATGSNSIAAQGSSPVTFTHANGHTGFVLFYQGNNSVGGGTGVAFGDGLRCAGVNIQRIQAMQAGGGTATTTNDVVAAGQVVAGQTRTYQTWYRNNPISLCGTLFNLSNGYTITWVP